ncbi:hypothetical protein [Chitinophaga eiseniae]|uniref:Uncharacterized protein n=1 Tax=Chitinophaga eiseniae TaxID=634771 RepID=A0A847SUR3_9BACT|nr:hypothetical protein [Chitinophaga eiseniae]NLR81459.1 hypothetical protein [Chitinophaga eiseniae]
MRKLIIALCCCCLTAPALLAQSALKIKLHPVIALQLVEPPASLEAAWKLAHRQDDPVTTVIPLQDVYAKGHHQLSALVARIDASGKPTNNRQAAQMGKEIENINSLASEMAAWQQSLEMKYYKQLRNQDISVHKAIDVREDTALKALPLITSGEYTDPDPMKEKAVSNQYFNEHMKAATAMLEKDRQLWLQFKKEYLSGLARYDARLEALGWGDNINNPLLKPGVANLQKGLLELADKLLECDQKITYTAASWYGTYLDRPETKRQQKEITMAYLNVSF